LFQCRIRATAGDFRVDELLRVEFSGDGEHDWLQVEKTGANTDWVARQLARHAGTDPRDVGYSGLKDRHAVTIQWFSVRAPAVTDWQALNVDGVRLLDRQRHRRKLRRGTHSANRFRIALRGRDLPGIQGPIEERLALIGGQGIPNYFGEQRFGRGGGNLDLGRAALDGRRLPRHKRSLGLSALRSKAFNDELDERIAAGTWNRMLPGDTANLDGSGSLFPVDEVSEVIERRCAELDIHPTGTLPALGDRGVAESRRPLRARVRELQWTIEDDALWLEFTLGRGSYATAVLREIATYD
jgi:tRNA pseudouridine13 synthase